MYVYANARHFQLVCVQKRCKSKLIWLSLLWQHCSGYFNFMYCYHKGCTEDKSEYVEARRVGNRKENFIQPLDIIFQHCIVRVSLNVYMLRNIKIGYLGKGQWSLYSLSHSLFELCVSVTLCASLLPFLTTQTEFFLALFHSRFYVVVLCTFLYSEFLSFYCLHTRACKNLIYAFLPMFTYYSELSILIKYFFLLTLFNNVCCIFIMPKMYVILHMILL
jgi:hypothetical protein